MYRAGNRERVVDEEQRAPAVEGGAGVRDTEGDKVTHLQRRIRRNVEVGVLVVEPYRAMTVERVSRSL